MDTSERAFEQAIEEALLQQGYRARKSSDFSRPLSLDIGLVVEFVRATQPKEWAKLEAQYGAQTTEKFITRLHSEIGSRGVLDVLRRGIKDRGASIRLAYFMPATRLNPEHARLAGLNIFSVVRQLRYSQKNDNELDLTLCLNGVPLAS
jgi:type I restriction enzyme, R subunit